MSAIDTLQSLTSNLLSSISQPSTVLDNLAEQSANTLTSVGESFSEIFALSQSAEAELTSTLALTTTNVSDSLNTMQDELLSNLLGYNSGIDALASGQSALSDISDFSLDSVKESLQSSILGNLQANSIINAVTELSETQDVSTESTILDDLVNYAFNDDGFGLEDAFDTLNILQHIPVVSSIYQTVTEQENIGVVSQLAGDFLYGGPIGLAYSVIGLAYESYTGTSVSDTIAEFDYSGFISAQLDVEESDSTTTDTDNKTLFFDRNKEVIYSRN